MHAVQARRPASQQTDAAARLQGWFDDRVEARDALSKLKGLRDSMTEMDYHDLPWIEKDEREGRLFNPKADAMRR